MGKADTGRRTAWERGGLGRPVAGSLLDGIVVHASRGIIGFEQLRSFAWTRLPDDRFAGLRLLRSLDNLNFALLVLPLTDATGLLAGSDLAEARSICAEAEFYAVVTPPSCEDGSRGTANLMAPLVIDCQHALLRQIVLSNTRLPLRHPL